MGGQPTPRPAGGGEEGTVYDTGEAADVKAAGLKVPCSY